VKLWRYLSPGEVQNVRVVCKTFNMEVDHVLGLHVHLDGRKFEELGWIRTKAVRSCCVFYFQDMSYWMYLLGRPEVLKELVISDTSIICVFNLHKIFATYVNLRKFVAHFQEVGDCAWAVNMRVMASMGDLRLRSTLLTIDSLPELKACKWVMMFEGTSGAKNRNVNIPNDMACPKYLRLALDHYAGPITLKNGNNRYFWKGLLEHQYQLETLDCNFGQALWEWYANALVKNGKTLTTVRIRNVSSWDVVDPIGTADTSFDWNVFKNCPKLTSLAVFADSENRDGPMLFKPFRSGTLILNTLDLNFGYVHWSFYDSIIQACAGTLVSLTLGKLDTMNPATGRDTVFDWALFRKCQKLETLSLSGREFQVMNHKNLGDIPKSIRKMYLYFFAFNTHHLYYMGKYLQEFLPEPDFMQMCQVKGLAEGSYPEEYIMKVRKQKTPFQALKSFYNAFPIHPFAAAAALYLTVV